MGALLQYDISVVGVKNVDRALSSIETRFAQHNARVGRVLGTTRSGRSGGGSASSTIKQAEREGKALAREQQRQSDYWHKAKLAQARQLHALEERERKKKAREEERDAKKKQRLVEQQLKAERAEREKFVRSTVGNSASRIGRTVKAVGGAGLALTGIAGAGLAASSVAQASKLDEMTRRLSIAGRDKGEKGVDPTVLRKEFTNTGIATGFSPEEITSGVAAYVAQTGDLDTARKNQRTYATVAQGAGANVTEVFEAAANLADKMDVTSVEDMAAAFAILSAQGKKGSFELKAMAAQFPEVFSSAANAGAKGLRGVRDVGATMQIAKKATGSDSEAATAVNAMFRQLAAKAADMQSGKAFSGRKVQVYEKGDPTKQMHNFAEVAQNAISASRGNVAQLNEVFDSRGVKALNPMINAYKTAYNAKGGGKAGDAAGREAMKGMFEKFSEVSADFSEVQRDANDAMQSFSVQMEILNNQLKDVVASELFPELIKVAPKLKELVPEVGKLTRNMVELASWAADNPFAAMGGAVTAAVVAEVGKAAIAKTITEAMTPAFTSAAAGALKFSAAAGAAALAVYAAYDQNEKLKQETGGKGILDVSWEWLTTDKDLKQIADENLDKQAKQRRAEQDAEEARQAALAKTEGTKEFKAAQAAPGGGSAGGTSPEPKAARSAGGAASGETINAAAARMERAAAAQEAAAKHIEEAAKKMGVSAPNRGPAPSPVKP